MKMSTSATRDDAEEVNQNKNLRKRRRNTDPLPHVVSTKRSKPSEVLERPCAQCRVVAKGFEDNFKTFYCFPCWRRYAAEGEMAVANTSPVCWQWQKKGYCF